MNIKKEGEKYFHKEEIDIDERISFQEGIITSLEEQLLNARTTLDELSELKNG